MSENKITDAQLDKIIEAVKLSGYYPYQDYSCDAKYDAKRNLGDRTHYVDDDTLRYFDARVLHTHTPYKGLFFAMVESVKHPNLGRVYRPVIFDVFGTVLDRGDIEHASKRSEPATKLMWEKINALDPKAYYLEVLTSRLRGAERQMQDLMAARKLLK